MDEIEIILLIQQGHNELYTDLWLRLYALIAKWAKEYYRSILRSGTATGGVTAEDLVQSGYFALVAAVEGYDPSRGSFITYLSYHIKNEFRRAIGRSDSQLHDPLNSAFSLDAPVNKDDPDSETWYDMAADNPDGRNDFDAVEERIFQEQLHDALECALNALPKKEANAIRSEYWDGCSLKETADRIGCSSEERARQIRNEGLNHIRNGSSRKRLEQFLNDSTSFYKGVGLIAFKQTQTSGVERLVLRRERIRAELEKQLDIITAPEK